MKFTNFVNISIRPILPPILQYISVPTAGLDFKFYSSSLGGYQVENFGRQVEILLAIFYCVGSRAAWGWVWGKLAHMYYYN
jgi:hypothetical protein